VAHLTSKRLVNHLLTSIYRLNRAGAVRVHGAPEEDTPDAATVRFCFSRRRQNLENHAEPEIGQSLLLLEPTIRATILVHLGSRDMGCALSESGQEAP
jgi:hypothetical protein